MHPSVAEGNCAGEGVQLGTGGVWHVEGEDSASLDRIGSREDEHVFDDAKRHVFHACGEDPSPSVETGC